MSQACSHDRAICLSSALEVDKAKVMCEIRKRRREAGLVGIRYYTKNIWRANAAMFNSKEAQVRVRLVDTLTRWQETVFKYKNMPD